ncbi:DNA cytosine methyltransferase [Streptomyces sp. NPDC056437]|uniref:DNA cytosine methyltransferase n=1 Tax=Streptomyces sp. NPDC056437 TaxID=3345816 RepID=UPI0036CAE3B3
MILDGFAGPGGWSEGIRRHLGLHDVGLEWDDAACKTRAAAGHTTIRVDVSAFVLAPLIGRVWGLIMSPPCTKLSAAGTGIGRRFLHVLADGIRRTMRGEDCREEIRGLIYPVALGEQKKRNAKRRPSSRWSEGQVEQAARDDAFVTVLMLEPARYLNVLICGRTSGIPLEWAAFEQVPAAEPLWQVYVQELRRLGWSAVAGVLNAADYGAGQDRPRAVLIASCVRAVALPAKTHGEQWGDDLFGGRLLPRVTMAQALGWGYTQRPAPTVTGDGTGTGGAEPFGNGSRKAMYAAMADQRHWAWKRPAHTVSGTVGHVGGKQTGGHLNLEPEEGAVLQTFRADYPFQGNKGQRSRQIGDAVPPLLAAHAVSAATGLHVRTAQALAA